MEDYKKHPEGNLFFRNYNGDNIFECLMVILFFIAIVVPIINVILDLIILNFKTRKMQKEFKDILKGKDSKLFWNRNL